MLHLGLDIGGTKTECALLEIIEGKDQKNYEGFSLHLHQSKRKAWAKVIQRKRISTERRMGYETALEKISTLCRDVLKEANISVDDIDYIGIGLPGSVHPKTFQMLTGNSALFVGNDLVRDLAKQLNFSRPVYCFNDAGCFALAETLGGAGLSFESETGKPPHEQLSVGLILGTGVGGGIISKGNIFTGVNGGAGEVGHLELFTNGHPCYCGQNGCVEQYLSGPAIEAAFASRIYSQIEKRPNAKEIFRLAQALDPIAIAVIREYQKNLAKFLALLTNSFDPDYFILGGGVSQQEILLDGLEPRISAKAFIPGVHPRIYQNKLGDSSGVIGACLLAFQNQNL